MQRHYNWEKETSSRTEAGFKPGPAWLTSDCWWSDYSRTHYHYRLPQLRPDFSSDLSEEEGTLLCRFWCKFWAILSPPAACFRRRWTKESLKTADRFHIPSITMFVFCLPSHKLGLTFLFIVESLALSPGPGTQSVEWKNIYPIPNLESTSLP